MIYEYAVDPAVMTGWQRVRYFLESFGPSRGRLLANYPKKWKRIVYESLSALPDVEKKRVEEQLSRLHRSAFSARSSAPYEPNLGWLENARIEHCRKPFRAIIAESARLGEEHILGADETTAQHELWAVPHGRMIERDPSRVASVLEPMLALSSTVCFIDPYFRASTPNKVAVLVALANILPKAVTSIDVHYCADADQRTCTVRDKDAEQRHVRWCIEQAQRALPKQLPKGVRVCLRAWRERPSGPRLHNRYVITDIGGVQFGDGIEAGELGHVDRISILDDESLSSIRAQFDAGKPAFDLVGAPCSVSRCEREGGNDGG